MKVVEVLRQASCVVVIPVYKRHLSIEEKWSFQRCLQFLSDYDIILVGSSKLKMDVYMECASIVGKKFRFQPFPSIYFKSISGYNNLLLSKAFYNRFKSYEFMLLYQLDAYVFNQDLSTWLNKGFDYIGAPSFDHLDQFIPESTWVGNGGLSLRRIQAFLAHYNSKTWYATYVRVSLLHKESFLKKIIEAAFLFLQAFILKHPIPISFSRVKYEDLFWSHTGYLNIPDFQTASEFSFEKFPSLLFERNSENLPFGCHAWAIFEYETFWKNFIPGK